MNVIDFNSLKNKVNKNIMERLREFDEYYEYCFITKYEEKFIGFETNSFLLNDVHAVTLEAQGKFFLVGILFYKENFSLAKIIDWLNLYNIKYANTDNFVVNASEIIKGVLFKGNVIVLYKKGRKNVEIHCDDFIEITDYYEYIEDEVDIGRSMSTKIKSTQKLVIHLNGKEINEIPRLEFQVKKYYIICNGILINADYIDVYNGNTIGFFKKTNPTNPIASLIDIHTEVYIEFSEREDGVIICLINYNFAINPYEL